VPTVEAAPPVVTPLAAGGQSSRSHHSGTVGGQPVICDPTFLGVVPTRIQLTAAWTLGREPGFPSRPSLTGSAVPDYAGRVIPSGTVMYVTPPEAASLIAMGAAVAA
jgi:hypothetical protein